MSDADKYIYFEERPVPEARQTRIVSVLNRRSGAELGQIRWYGAWRQYCFYPLAATVYNTTCMARITSEMTAMMIARTSER